MPVLALLFVGLAAIFGATVEKDGGSIDLHSAALGSWTLATTGSPWVDHIPEESLNRMDPTGQQLFVETNSDGHRVVARTPGVILTGVPAYALTQPAELDLLPASLTAALLTAGTVTFLFALLVPLMDGRRRAMLAAIVFGLATPIWSVAADGLWTHSVTGFGLTGMAWACSRERWWLAGFLGGVAVWGRAHTALVVAVVGLAIALARRRPGVAMRMGLTSGLLTALACAWSYWLYGTWQPGGGVDTGARAASSVAGMSPELLLDRLVNQAGFWVAPDRGLLVWTPLLLVLAPALVRSWRGLPDWSRALCVGGMLYLLVQGWIQVFHGGDTYWGYRLGLEMLVCLAPALALSARQMGPVARRLFVPVGAVQFAMIALGALANLSVGPASDAWTSNSVLRLFGAAPVPVTFLFTAAVLLVVLFARIWTNPTLERRRTPTTASAGQ